jgi:hypothetical protein
MHSVAEVSMDLAGRAMDVACRVLMHVELIDFAAIHTLAYHS